MKNPFWTTAEKEFQRIDVTYSYRERLYRLFQLITEGRDAVVALCAIDNFRLVNQKYGRETGDSVLERAWGGLISKLPERGVAARLFGDGFVIAFPGTEPELQRVVEMLSSKIPYQEKHPLSWSIGCTLLPAPSNPMEWRSAFEEVDRSLNEAKKRGGNIVLLFKGIDQFRVIANGPPSRSVYSNGPRDVQ